MSDQDLNMNSTRNKCLQRLQETEWLTKRLDKMASLYQGYNKLRSFRISRGSETMSPSYYDHEYYFPKCTPKKCTPIKIDLNLNSNARSYKNNNVWPIVDIKKLENYNENIKIVIEEPKEFVDTALISKQKQYIIETNNNNYDNEETDMFKNLLSITTGAKTRIQKLSPSKSIWGSNRRKVRTPTKTVVTAEDGLNNAGRDLKMSPSWPAVVLTYDRGVRAPGVDFNSRRSAEVAVQM